AVEKHLAPIMSSFICTNNNDEKILIEILSSYSSDHRPPIYVRTYTDQVHDISGTLENTKKANLLTIYDVLKIDNITVEYISIDELESDIKSLNEQIKQMNESLNQLKTIQQTTIDEISQAKKASTNNKKKIRELMKVIKKKASYKSIRFFVLRNMILLI